MKFSVFCDLNHVDVQPGYQHFGGNVCFFNPYIFCSEKEQQKTSKRLYLSESVTFLRTVIFMIWECFPTMKGTRVYMIVHLVFWLVPNSFIYSSKWLLTSVTGTKLCHKTIFLVKIYLTGNASRQKRSVRLHSYAISLRSFVGKITKYVFTFGPEIWIYYITKLSTLYQGPTTIVISNHWSLRQISHQSIKKNM